MSPRGIYICDGSVEEASEVIQKLVERGTLEKLEKMENWYDVDVAICILVLLRKVNLNGACQVFT